MTLLLETQSAVEEQTCFPYSIFLCVPTVHSLIQNALRLAI